MIDQLDQSDLATGVYEGGFKTWECAVDLASLLLDRGPRKDIDELIRCDQVIEVRCDLDLAGSSRSLTWVLLARSWFCPTNTGSVPTCAAECYSAYVRPRGLQ